VTLEECFASSGAVEVAGDKGEEGGRVGGFGMDLLGIGLDGAMGLGEGRELREDEGTEG
jgi:hypothetical protein